MNKRTYSLELSEDELEILDDILGHCAATMQFWRYGEQESIADTIRNRVSDMAIAVWQRRKNAASIDSSQFGL